MLRTLKQIQKQLERLELICTAIAEDIEDIAEVLDDYYEDDLEGMMPCDFTGYCNISCPHYGIDCDGI